jgi:hypothetical protein
MAANFAKFTRPLCKPALSPFLFVHGERSRVAEKTIDRLSGHLARLGRRFLAALLRRLCTAGKRLSESFASFGRLESCGRKHLIPCKTWDSGFAVKELTSLN